MIAGYRHFAGLAQRLRWDPRALDLSGDRAAFTSLPAPRRERLGTLLAGLRVAEASVAEELEPFAVVSEDPTAAAVLRAQARDERVHAVLFDRIAGEVLRLDGDTPEERRTSARIRCSPLVLELFERRLPAVAAGLASGAEGLDRGLGLYHMVLEGIALASAQLTLLDDLSDGALPGVREGVERVERDERWHVGFGLRCLLDAAPSAELVQRILREGVEAAGAWGDAVPEAVSARVLAMHRRRLATVGLVPPRGAAAAVEAA